MVEKSVMMGDGKKKGEISDDGRWEEEWRNQ
jgi:hypothetical protein